LLDSPYAARSRRRCAITASNVRLIILVQEARGVPRPHTDAFDERAMRNAHACAQARRTIAAFILDPMEIYAVRRATMRPRLTDRRLTDLVLIAILFTICCAAPSEPLQLRSIKLGTAVDDSSRVVSLTRNFAPGDVVHVAIETIGYGSATLTLQWLANEQIVSTDTRAITGTGENRFAFQFAPGEGWPIGTGKIVFWLDPAEKHVAEFAVQ
jgi:hypothetical protein